MSRYPFLAARKRGGGGGGGAPAFVGLRANPILVTPAKAGVQRDSVWTPAFAGVTDYRWEARL